ncbi:phage tail protein I [Ensifer sp. LCM 4579]|uniref:phage tail protein I n=1 Tax=Ensifer sp. LCM 4579 TaxID=1848292 RepID=UPI0008D9E822|nr:phage tail protein I [Ensifer sp. LCM 4579]OHV85806.1 phage tail protein I [Ensifer sp. LCM 4579]
MSTFETILPSNAKPLELDLEKATAFLSILGLEDLGDLTNPRAIRADLLPWLAYRFSTDIWREEWSAEKRRDVVAQQFDLHRLKGTAEGIRRMVELVDAEIKQIIVPPKRIFAMPAIGKAARNAWLARMPQIRVYLANNKGTIGADAFGGVDGRARGAFAGRAFARLDRAAAIYGRRAVIRQPDGTETNVRRSEVETTVQQRTAREFDRIHIPGKIGPALFAGGFVGKGFVTKRNKQAEIVTFSLDRQYDAVLSELHLSTVSPGLDPVDVKYSRVSDRWRPGPALYARRFKGFAIPDRAAEHLYDRIFLNDPAVDAPWVRAHSYAGHARIGMPAFRADMLIKKMSKKQRRAGFAGHTFVGRSFSTKEDLTALKMIYAAVRRSKAARDRVFVDTQTLRRPVFGDGIPLDGTFKFGQSAKRRLT